MKKQTLHTLTKVVSYSETHKGVQGNVPAPAAHHWYEGPANDPGETVEHLLHHVVVQRLPGEVLLHRESPVRITRQRNRTRASHLHNTKQCQILKSVGIRIELLVNILLLLSLLWPENWEIKNVKANKSFSSLYNLP